MKKTTVWDKLWYVFVAAMALMILIPYGYVAYGLIFGFPDEDMDYLSWETDVSVDEPWINEAFEIEISNVQIGDVDANNLRPCEIIMKVKNHDVVTHRSSRDLMTFVQYESDSVDAYRGSHETTEPDEAGEKPKKAVKKIMEIWTDLYEEGGNKKIIKHGLTSFFVEKGKTAFFVYQASVPETTEYMTLTLQVSTNKKHNNQYRREYILNINDYLNDTAE